MNGCTLLVKEETQSWLLWLHLEIILEFLLPHWYCYVCWWLFTLLGSCRSPNMIPAAHQTAEEVSVLLPASILLPFLAKVWSRTLGEPALVEKHTCLGWHHGLKCLQVFALLELLVLWHGKSVEGNVVSEIGSSLLICLLVILIFCWIALPKPVYHTIGWAETSCKHFCYQLQPFCKAWCLAGVVHKGQPALVWPQVTRKSNFFTLCWEQLMLSIVSSREGWIQCVYGHLLVWYTIFNLVIQLGWWESQAAWICQLYYQAYSAE